MSYESKVNDLICALQQEMCAAVRGEMRRALAAESAARWRLPDSLFDDAGYTTPARLGPHLRFGAQTIRRWCVRGEFPGAEKAHGRWRLARSVVDAWWDGCHTKTEAEMQARAARYAEKLARRRAERAAARLHS